MSKFALFSINQQIECLRKEMLELVKSHGFTHPKVIECSQQLDKFIFIVQQQKNRKIG